MKIYLMRHGESTSDIDDLYGGDYEDHLTKKGQSQAKDLANKLADSKIDIIYSSPRWRAKETAEIISEKIGCPVEVVENIRERNAYGYLTGVNKIEAKEKYPNDVEILKNYSSNIQGAETYGHFKERILIIFNELTSKNYQTIGILTHGGPIRCIFREILGLGELDQLDDCAVFQLDKKGNVVEVINK